MSNHSYEEPTAQKVLDIMFQVSMTIQNERAIFDKMSNDDLANWINEQLASCHIPVQPVGSKWAQIQQKAQNEN
jgi:hypothetical protein